MIDPSQVNTIADGTAVKRPGEKLFPYIQQNVDDIITIEDSESTLLSPDMVENHKMIVENSGLLTVAALKDGLKCGKRKNSFYIKRWKYGRDHYVFYRSAWPDPERQDLHCICSPS